MAVTAFGKTWWGNSWLNALMHTDYSNRLPRGRSYARNGSVLSLSVSPNQGVLAAVQGSRRQPYQISLSLKTFSKKEIQIIVDEIVANPQYLSSLLNRKLPEELYSLFEAKGIHLFPKQWKEITANCSCPDWASCCKHLAAVIYMIANEIDKNPFTLFHLHGFDIFKELSNRQYFLETENHTIKRYDDFVAEVIGEGNATENIGLDGLDFSKIPFLKDQLLSLLSDEPLFEPNQNFKATLNQFYKHAATQVKKISFEAQLPDEEQIVALSVDDVDIKLTLKKNKLKREIICKFINSPVQSMTFSPITFIPSIILTIPNKKVEFLPVRLTFLYYVVLFSAKLVEQGAMMPEIVAVGSNYAIRWVPALLNQEVKDIATILIHALPTEGIIRTADNKRFHKEEELKEIVSIFLEYFVRMSVFSFNGRRSTITDLFFFNTLYEPRSFEQKEIPTTIALWLSKFSITHKDYVPLIVFSEVSAGFDVSVFVNQTSQPMNAPEPLYRFFEDKKLMPLLLPILKDMELLADYFPELGKIIKEKGRTTIQFSFKDFGDVLFNYLPIFRMLGIPMLLPKALDYLVKPKLSLTVNKKASKEGKGYLSLIDMLSFDWTIALGDAFMTPHEFKTLLKQSSGLVKIKDQYVYIHDQDVSKILKALESEPQLSTQEKMRTLLADEYNSAPLVLSADIRDQIQAFFEAKQIPVSPNLHAELRPYQRRGYDWLYKNAMMGFGSLIADDMGLGKTIQVITLLLKLKEEDMLKKTPALIVVPTTLLTNWSKEIEKFAPELSNHVYHGSKRRFKDEPCDVLLTTYGLIRSDHETFVKQKWALLILDEAQNIKNPDTHQTKAIKSLKSDIKIAMTGTPVENRLTEYWSIFDFLNKGLLYNFKTFVQEFTLPIEINRDQQKLGLFHKITAPFMIRRLKTDKSIINDLPDKIENDTYTNLTKEQSALYQNTVDAMLKKLEDATGIDRKGLVFKLMTELKQICNHPAHYLKENEAQADLSGKTLLLLDVLDQLKENEEKVIIFTQYKEMGDLLQSMIQKHHHSEVLFLHGGVSRKKRDEMVNAFQTQPHPKVFILSLKAGGTGLNLTAANHVIHFDLWWNPAIETQATDRAFRIGQKSNVIVYRFITKGTFEEKINEMIQKKKELANLAVTSGEKWIGELSIKELKDIFQLSKEAS